VASVTRELERLEVIRSVGLPSSLFAGVPPHEVELGRRRVAVQPPSDLRRLPEPARLAPLQARPDPENLEAIKAEVTATWPMTSLLDIIKEADLRLGFTDALGSPTAYETLDRGELRARLLLCLHGLGTNTGLRRLDAGHEGGPSYRDLAYARRRYLTPDRLREAIAVVTNGTLRTRNPLIWGEGTTACASDSKHFGAWDQNLTTQWHVRYGGRGVMIYRHVERNSLCIHSQLKSPSSSEVASMIEGVLRHCTEMAVDRQYVDSHGQSVVAFAFTRLLGFQLLPRLQARMSAGFNLTSLAIELLSSTGSLRCADFPHERNCLTTP
jgi:hypothetical protein